MILECWGLTSSRFMELRSKKNNSQIDLASWTRVPPNSKTWNVDVFQPRKNGLEMLCKPSFCMWNVHSYCPCYALNFTPVVHILHTMMLLISKMLSFLLSHWSRAIQDSLQFDSTYFWFSSIHRHIVNLLPQSWATHFIRCLQTTKVWSVLFPHLLIPVLFNWN